MLTWLINPKRICKLMPTEVIEDDGIGSGDMDRTVL